MDRIIIMVTEKKYAAQKYRSRFQPVQ